MPKHYKDMIDELINKMDEDAPANAVAHGGVDMNPTGKKVKKKDDAEDVLRRTIMKKLGANVKENFDNNNVVLKGINETLNKLEDKIDELQITFVPRILTGKYSWTSVKIDNLPMELSQANTWNLKELKDPFKASVQVSLG